MASPYDYIGDLPNPAAQITQGLQSGMALAQGAQQMRLQREQAAGLAQVREAQIAENQAQAAKIQQDMARAQARNTKIAGMVKEGVSATGITNLIAEFPEIAEHYKPALEQLNSKEKQARFEQMAPVLAAMNAGDNTEAQLQVSKMIDAYEASGKTKEAEAAQQWLTLFQRNPEQGKLVANVSMAALVGPDKFESTFGGLETTRREQELQPGKIAKAMAEGKIAEIKAQYQEQVEQADLALKGAQTTQAKASAYSSSASAKKALAEIDRIKELTPEERRKLVAETNKLEAETAAKRGELSVPSALDAGQRVLDTVQTLRGLGKGNFSVLSNIAGPVTSKFPTTTPVSADAENAIETLKSQVFLQQIKNMKGMGALSEKEGDRLAASVANLSLSQSPAQLQKNIEYIEKTTKTAMEKMQSMGGARQPSAETSGMSDDDLKKALGL